MKKYLWILALLVISSLLLVACGAATETSAPVVEEPAVEEPVEEPTEVIEEPVEEVGLPDLGGREVIIAIENAYLPYNYIDPDTGEPSGWDYDVWDEICNILNCVPVYTEAAWEGMIQAVADGQFDAGADGVTITDDRAEIVDFSMGYMAIEQRLLVRIDEDRIESIDDIVNDENLKLGTQTGTTNYETASKYLPADRIQAFEQFPFAVQALISGDIDAVIIDETAGQGYMGENAEALKLVGPSLSSDQLGFLYPKGSDLVEPVNMALEELMKNGFLEGVNAVYFGPDFGITYDDLFPPEPTLGDESMPIKVLFVPSVDVDFMIESGSLIEQALNEATGLYFEVSVPTSYAATIEEMCASPTDTIGFIPAMGYALASDLCGVEPGLASVRYGWNVYWTAFYVGRDSDIQTLEDLEGTTWAYPDAGSTSGYLYPSAIWDDLGITFAETVEAGGHPQAVRSVYNGEADVATAYFSAPLLPEGTWTTDMAPDVPDDVVDLCAVDADDHLMCDGYRILDARAAIMAEAPDVVQKVRILTLSGEIPNDTMSFSPEFPEDLKQVIMDAIIAYVGSEACEATLCNESFYDWTGAAPIYDENFDGVRLLMEAQGITLETLD